MQPLNAVEAITPAFTRTRQVLFQPLLWLRFLVICCFTAWFLPSFDFNFPGSDRWFPVGPVFDQFKALSFSPVVTDVGIAIAVVFVIVAVVVVLAVAFRLPFMRFDLVTGHRSNLREIWKWNGDNALQWFGYCFCLGIAGAVGNYILRQTADHLAFGQHHAAAATIKTGLAASIGTLCLWASDDFLVPILVLKGFTVVQAIRDFWTLFLAAPIQFCAYFIAKCILVAATSTLFVLLGILWIPLFLKPCSSFLLALLNAHTVAGTTSISFSILLAGLACLAWFLALLLIYVLLAGPVAIFFEAYAVVFFASQYRPLYDLLYPGVDRPYTPPPIFPGPDEPGSGSGPALPMNPIPA